MPVFPDVGSRMIESAASRPRRSRSSTRYFATRSLTEPVGLTISSLAKIRTAGLGDIRGISTSGVWPTASRMSAYRPQWGVSSWWAWTWACARASARAASPASASCSRGRTTTGFGSAISARVRAAGHRRQETDLVALADRGRQAVEIANVLTIDVDVHEPVEAALVGQELAPERRVLVRQRRDELADGRAAQLHLLVAPDLGPEDRRDLDDAHAGPPRTNGCSAAGFPNDGIGSGRPSARAATASVEQTGQSGSRRSFSSVKVVSSASKSSSRPASVSPIPRRTLSASLAWSMPMIPGTTPRTPATEQPGASSGGGGVG